jgi:pyrroloquinoline quinone biosynthesis protein D
MNELSTLPQQKPRRREDLWLRTVEAESSIFDPQTEHVHLLNETALAIWQICDGQTTAREMVDAICELSGLAEEVVAEDVLRTLRQFTKLGLITWED